jgi:hypothetical protein
MDWLALRHRHATPVEFWPKDNILVPDPEKSDALAHTIEKVAGSAVCVVLALVLAFVFLRRAARDRVARYSQ